MKNGQPYALLAATLLLALGTVACGSSSNYPTSPGGGGAPGTVVISNFSFAPISMTVAVNTTVTWRNDDSATHTATSDSSSAFTFDTGSIPSGSTSRGIVFNQAGTFPYHCSFHSSMHGTIVVQ